MKYLLDVNALLALGFDHHQFHERVAVWVGAERQPTLATCSITELGFVRILCQTPLYQLTLVEARSLLLRLKNSNVFPFTFLLDDHDISHLPAWVKSSKQTTDGHLAQLASAQGAILATLDERIPGAFLIP